MHLNVRHLPYRCLEAGCLGWRCWPTWFTEHDLLARNWQPSRGVSWGRESLVSLPLIKGTRPINLEPHPYALFTFITSSQAPSPNAVTLELRVSAYEFEQGINIQSITCYVLSETQMQVFIYLHTCLISRVSRLKSPMDGWMDGWMVDVWMAGGGWCCRSLFPGHMQIMACLALPGPPTSCHHHPAAASAATHCADPPSPSLPHPEVRKHQGR